MSKSVQTLKNCFAPIPEDQKPPLLGDLVFPKTFDEIVLIPEAVNVDGDPENIVLQYKPVKKKTVDIDEYVGSFADEVGIQNILKKIAMSGDKSLLNQTGREPLCPEGGLEPVQDFSNVPKSKTEAFNAVVNGVNVFDQLGDDIKGKMSLEQFVQSFGQEEFDNYIKSVIASTQLKGEDK